LQLAFISLQDTRITQEPVSLLWFHAVIELAVYSCPPLCLQRQAAKPTRWLFYCWSLMR